MADFVSMVGSTGVASDGTDVFVAHNAKIKKVGTTKELAHGYSWVGGITIYDGKIFGICQTTDQKDAIFSIPTSLTLATSSDQKKIEVSYVPINLIYTTNLKLCVIDSTGVIHTYDKNLNSRNTYDIYHLTDSPYRPISMIEMYKYPYISIQNEIYFGIQKDLTLEHNIYSMAKDGSNKWIMYASSGRTYLIQGYDQMNQRIGTAVTGGILPENQMYSCILGDDLYISSSVNKKMTLPDRVKPTEKDQPDWNTTDRTIENHTFSEITSYDPIAAEKKLEAIVLEPKPTEKKLSLMYVWITICLVLLAILAAMLNGETPSFLYVLLILSGVVLFLITSIL